MFKKWKDFAKKVGDTQVTFVFKLFYFLIITPVGFFATKFSDLLETKSFPVWKQILESDKSINEMRQQ